MTVHLIASAGTLADHFARIPLTLPTVFPAQFGGSKIAYALDLFSQMAISLGCAATMIELWRLYRAHEGRWREPAQMQRIAFAGLLMCLFMNTFPGAIFNLMWRETPTETLRMIQLWRIYMRGLSWMPCLVGMGSLALARHAITYQLTRKPLPVDLWANRRQMMKSSAICVVCFAIAIIVAYAK